MKDNYLSTVKPGAGVHGSFYSYRDIYLDLDPTYTDRFGRPLMRITMDLKENEIKQNKFLTDKFAESSKRWARKRSMYNTVRGRTTSRPIKRPISTVVP